MFDHQFPCHLPFSLNYVSCKDEDIIETSLSTNKTFEKSPKSRIFPEKLFKSLLAGD